MFFLNNSCICFAYVFALLIYWLYMSKLFVCDTSHTELFQLIHKEAHVAFQIIASSKHIAAY